MCEKTLATSTQIIQELFSRPNEPPGIFRAIHIFTSQQSFRNLMVTLNRSKWISTDLNRSKWMDVTILVPFKSCCKVGIKDFFDLVMNKVYR